MNKLEDSKKYPRHFLAYIKMPFEFPGQECCALNFPDSVDILAMAIVRFKSLFFLHFTIS